MRASKARIVWLRADGETPGASAARLKLRASATATKARRWAKSLPVMIGSMRTSEAS